MDDSERVSSLWPIRGRGNVILQQFYTHAAFRAVEPERTDRTDRTGRKCR